MSLLTLPVPLDETETPEEAQATGAPTPPMNALLALAMRQQQERQKRQGEANAALEQQAVGHRGQAQALRNLALLSSFGSNPLLRGMQAEAGQQGAQLEGTAARADARIATPEDGLDPLGLARLAQLAEYQRKQQELADAKLKQDKEIADAKAEAARNKAAAAKAKAQAAYDAKLLKEKEKQLLGNIKLEGGLRKEVQGLPAYKNYQLGLVAFDQIQRAAKDPSPAGDIAVITNYMRSLDPTTGVKEQEFNNAQNAGGFDDKARAGWERIMSGKRLSPEQRQDFVRSAESNTRALKDPYDRAIKYYEGLAQRYNVDPRNIAAPAGMDLAPTDAPAPPPAPRVPAAQAMPPGPNGSLLLEPPPARTTQKRTPREEAALAWARDPTNKDDPRAAAILQRLGVKE